MGVETIEITNSFWTGRKKIVFQGQCLNRTKEKGKPFILNMKDGIQKKIYVYGLYPDLVHKIKIDDKEIIIEKAFTPVEYIGACLPLLLLLIGGALGGFIGGAAASINIRLLRTKQSKFIKFLQIFGITVVAIILFLISAMSLHYVFNNSKTRSLEKKAASNPENVKGVSP